MEVWAAGVFGGMLLGPSHRSQTAHQEWNRDVGVAVAGIGLFGTRFGGRLAVVCSIAFFCTQDSCCLWWKGELWRHLGQVGGGAGIDANAVAHQLTGGGHRHEEAVRLTLGIKINKTRMKFMYYIRISSWCQEGNTSSHEITEVKYFELNQFYDGWKPFAPLYHYSKRSYSTEKGPSSWCSASVIKPELLLPSGNSSFTHNHKYRSQRDCQIKTFENSIVIPYDAMERGATASVSMPNLPR